MPRKPIKDEFSDLPISRQRKWQLRMERDRRCTICGEPALVGIRCLKHLVMAREKQRKTRGMKRRYHNTLSYRLQSKPAEVAAFVKQMKDLENKRIASTSAKRKK